jgi:hypothetical protein
VVLGGLAVAGTAGLAVRAVALAVERGLLLLLVQGAFLDTDNLVHSYLYHETVGYRVFLRVCGHGAEATVGRKIG